MCICLLLKEFKYFMGHYSWPGTLTGELWWQRQYFVASVYSSVE